MSLPPHSPIRILTSLKKKKKLNYLEILIRLGQFFLKIFQGVGAKNIKYVRKEGGEFLNMMPNFCGDSFLIKKG